MVHHLRVVKFGKIVLKEVRLLYLVNREFILTKNPKLLHQGLELSVLDLTDSGILVVGPQTLQYLLRVL